MVRCRENQTKNIAMHVVRYLLWYGNTNLAHLRQHRDRALWKLDVQPMLRCREKEQFTSINNMGAPGAASAIVYISFRHSCHFREQHVFLQQKTLETCATQSFVFHCLCILVCNSDEIVLLFVNMRTPYACWSNRWMRHTLSKPI